MECYFNFFDKYKNGVSQIAIIISIIVFVKAIDIIKEKSNIPIKANDTNKKFSVQLLIIVDILFLNHNFFGYFSFSLLYKYISNILLMKYIIIDAKKVLKLTLNNTFIDSLTISSELGLNNKVNWVIIINAIPLKILI